MFARVTVESFQIVTRNRRVRVMLGVPFHVPEQKRSNRIYSDCSAASPKIVGLGFPPDVHRIVDEHVIPLSAVETRERYQNDEKPIS